MAKTEEQVKVGAFVVIAAVLFLTALVFVGGVNLFRKKKAVYTTYFKFAGGLEPGSFVRFGGLKVGTVRDAEIDPKDSTRIRVRLQVDGGTPFRTNSRARISTLGFLGENYVEVSPGTRDAPLLPTGSELPALEIVQLADVFNNVNNVTVNANKLVNDLDDRVLSLSDNANKLIGNLNDVVSAENKQHLQAALSNLDGILAENRPRLKATIANMESASAKLPPTLDHTNAAISHVEVLTDNLNKVVVENRNELHDVLVKLRDSLTEVRRLTSDLDDTLAADRANLDETLENIRVSSENLKEFTETIKERPFSLIRIKTEKDRLPPAGK